MSVPSVCSLPGVLVALLTLNACATSSAPVHAPVGARVLPVHRGIQIESPHNAESQRVYVWHVHDYDGSNHVLTWDDTGAVAQDVLPKLSACVHAYCADVGPLPTTTTTCSHKPVRPQLFRALQSCVDSLGMSQFQVATEPGAMEYTVQIITGSGATYMAAGEIQLSRSLGAQRTVTSPVPADTIIVHDVDSCLRSAAAHGVIESCGITRAGCTTIKPMLARFDACLRSHAYTVDASNDPP